MESFYETSVPAGAAARDEDQPTVTSSSDDDKLLLGSALALLAVAASSGLLLAQVARMQRHLGATLTLRRSACVLVLGGARRWPRRLKPGNPGPSPRCTPGPPYECSGWRNTDVALTWCAASGIQRAKPSRAA